MIFYNVPIGVIAFAPVCFTTPKKRRKNQHRKPKPIKFSENLKTILYLKDIYNQCTFSEKDSLGKTLSKPKRFNISYQKFVKILNFDSDFNSVIKKNAYRHFNKAESMNFCLDFDFFFVRLIFAHCSLHFVLKKNERKSIISI